MFLVNMELDKYFDIFLKKKEKKKTNEMMQRREASNQQPKLLTDSMHEATFKQDIFDTHKSPDMPPSKEIEMRVLH